jgi:hypothetical protein
MLRLFNIFVYMKAIVIKAKNDNEFKFISDLLKKFGVGSSAITQEQLEDIGLSKLMKGIDQTKKANRAEIMKKLST